MMMKVIGTEQIVTTFGTGNCIARRTHHIHLVSQSVTLTLDYPIHLPVKRG